MCKRRHAASPKRLVLEWQCLIEAVNQKKISVPRTMTLPDHSMCKNGTFRGQDQSQKRNCGSRQKQLDADQAEQEAKWKMRAQASSANKITMKN
jgi:hypothetical protein